jgi:hypothetical protein
LPCVIVESADCTTGNLSQRRMTCCAAIPRLPPLQIARLRLRAAIRTRYRRTAFQSSTSNAVRVSLDTELQASGGD